MSHVETLPQSGQIGAYPAFEICPKFFPVYFLDYTRENVTQSLLSGSMEHLADTSEPQVTHCELKDLENIPFSLSRKFKNSIAFNTQIKKLKIDSLNPFAPNE